MDEAWFRRMREMFLDPAAHASFGMTLIELGPGEATLGLDPGPEFQNALGGVHGGVLATVLDSAMFQSVRTLLGPDDQLSTLELKINFLAPAEVGPFRCAGRAIRVGGSTGVAQATLTDGRGGAVATALGTIHVRRAGGRVAPRVP